MKIITSNSVAEKELPLQLKISFQKIIVLFEKYASQEFIQHPYHSAAKEIVLLFKKNPELKEGFSDYSLLDTYKEQIDLLLDQLFPEPLLLNEIKAVTIPFSFISFKLTKLTYLCLLISTIVQIPI